MWTRPGCGRSFRTEEHTTTARRGSTPARWWARAGGAYSDQDLLPELTAAELVRRFRAEDVRAFDMCGYIRMWNRLPSEPQQSARWMAAVERNNHRDRVFYPGDEVLFPQRGFGRVLAMEPVPSGQLLYIRFESGVEETLHARYVCKVVDGVIKTVDVRRKRCV